MVGVVRQQNVEILLLQCRLSENSLASAAERRYHSTRQTSGQPNHRCCCGYYSIMLPRLLGLQCCDEISSELRWFGLSYSPTFVILKYYVTYVALFS